VGTFGKLFDALCRLAKVILSHSEELDPSMTHNTENHDNQTIHDIINHDIYMIKDGAS
jgi:hypothetical protein